MPEINMFHFKVMGWGFCLKVLQQVNHKRVKKNEKTKTPGIYRSFEVAGCFHESSWQYMFKVFTGAKKKKNMYIQYVPKCFALWQIFFFLQNVLFILHTRKLWTTIWEFLPWEATESDIEMLPVPTFKTCSPISPLTFHLSDGETLFLCWFPVPRDACWCWRERTLLWL